MDDFLTALDLLDIIMGLKGLFVKENPTFVKAEQYFNDARNTVSKVINDEVSSEACASLKEQAMIAIQLFDKCKQNKHYECATINYYKGLCYLFISVGDYYLQPGSVKKDLGAALRCFKTINNIETSFATQNVDTVNNLKAEASELIILTNSARDSWLKSTGQSKGFIDIESMDTSMLWMYVLVIVVFAFIAYVFFTDIA